MAGLLDDVFGDEVVSGGDGGHTHWHAKNEWRQLQDAHATAGYREGVASVRERKLQEGFDSGYAEGAKVGLAWGKLRGVLSMLKCRVPTVPLKDATSRSDFEAAITALLTDVLSMDDVRDLFPGDVIQGDIATKTDCGEKERCCGGGDCASSSSMTSSLCAPAPRPGANDGLTTLAIRARGVLIEYLRMDADQVHTLLH